MLGLRFFGSPIITLNEQPLSTLTRSPTLVQLLAYLVLYRARPHPRPVLAALFWPDLSEARARQYLNTHLSRLRRLLKTSTGPKPGYLLCDSQTVQFNTACSFWLDVAEFETATTALCQPSLPALTTITEDSVEKLMYAVSLYRGDFLEGMYADWCLRIREQLREQYLLVMESLMRAHRADGHLEAAFRIARQLVQTDPLREEAHFYLLQLCFLLDRPHDARLHYRQYEAIWRDELKAEPSARMKVLIQKPGSPELASADPVTSLIPAPDIRLFKELAISSSIFLNSQSLSAPDDWMQIVDAAERAGHTLRTLSNITEALRYINLALDALRHVPESQARDLREISLRRECDQLYDLCADRTGQADNLEKAGRLVGRLNDPALHADLLGRQAWLMRKTGRQLEAITHLQEMSRLCQERGDRQQQAIASRLLGVVYDEAGNFRAALEWHSQALALDEAEGLKFYSSLDLNNRASVHLGMGNYSAALRDLDQAHGMLEADSEPQARATILGNIGSAWVRLGQFKKGAIQLQEAMALSRQAGDREVECRIGCRWATLQQRQGELNHALLMAHHYFHVALESRVARPTAELAALITSLYCEQRNGTSAMEWAHRTAEIAAENGYWRYTLRSTLYRARASLLLGDGPQSFQTAQMMASEFERHNQTLEEEPEIYYVLAQCAQAVGQEAVALVARKKAYGVLLDKAGWIEDADLRQQFLNSHPLYSAILGPALQIS